MNGLPKKLNTRHICLYLKMTIKSDEIIMEAFGKRFKQLRLSKGLTQQEVATKLRIEHSTVSRIERGKQNASLTLIHKLATAIETEPSSLLEFMP